MKIRTLNATITGFDALDNKLTVFFIPDGATRKFRVLAHPALQVKPHIGKVQELKIAETEQGWKLLAPYPSAEDIKAHEEIQARKPAFEEATEAQLALLVF